MWHTRVLIEEARCALHSNVLIVAKAGKYVF